MSQRLFALVALALAVPTFMLAQSAPQTFSTKKPNAPTQANVGKNWTPPKTTDGKPKLEGFWTNNTTTPLERPKGLGAKEFYTDAELAEVVKKEQNRVELNEEEGRPTEPGTDADVHYDFSQYGLDRGQAKIAWNKRTSIITGETGTVPTLLPEARKRQQEVAAKNRGHEFDGPENRPLSARCINLGSESVPMLPGGYNANFQIVQGDGYVELVHEMNHSTRIIPINSRSHPAGDIHTYKGDSIGHYEGNTLVIDSTNFTAKSPFRGSGDRLHVVERLTPVDPDTILYQFTVNDPDTWDKPWSGEMAWSRIEGPIYEFACHEGNYGLRNTLHGARVAEEEAAAKAAGK